MGKFNVMDFAPSVKYIGDEVFATVADGSYMVDTEFSPRNNRHILVGRYCSIARELLLMIGENHDYRGVTTYPVREKRYLSHIQSPPPPRQTKSRDYVVNKLQAIIGNDVWIGRRVTLMSGIRIGNGAIIGTGSVVAKSIPPYAIAVGNPARVIKYRFDPETIRKLQAIRWWNWTPEKILENISSSTDPQDIIEKFYSPDLEIVPKDSLGDHIRAFKSRGFKVFSTIADFNAKVPTWKKCVDNFISSKFIRNSILCIHLCQDVIQDQMNSIRDSIKNLSDEKMIFMIRSHDERPFSLDSLRETDVFVTTKEDDCSKAIDAMSDLNFETRYIFDDLVFF